MLFDVVFPEPIDLIFTDTGVDIVFPDEGIDLVLGMPGLQGPRGPDGVAESYTHVQNVPSAAWTVNHNLGGRPVVAIFSVGGEEVDAQVIHVNNNQLMIYFSSAFAGSARCI